MQNELLIKEIGNNEKRIINRLAAIHMKAFPDFFLTQLGLPFLKALYTGYVKDADSGIIIAEKGGSIVGFIAYSNDYPGFYKGLLKKHLIRFILCSMWAVIKHPSFCKRLFGALKKSDSVKKEEAYVELASICVDPQAEGNGIGTKLIDYLKSLVDFNKYEYINLETDADGNDEVNQFYLKNGFILERQYVTTEGRRMNEYRYREYCDK